MSRLPILLSVALFFSALLSVGSAAADAVRPVRINPFAQPLTAAPTVVRFGLSSGGGVSSTAAQGVSQPQLRGVLQAGANSFANIDGKIVGLNETVFGMRLKSVSETAAVFVRNGKNLVLKVSSTPVATESSALVGMNVDDSK